ncbi:hypothetical protein MANES_05G130301v8 [Manihot esculenta]|uniref:Uncharacterized protein n=1 Tax=Manihot esculenta TaxID=3983 RepID=A0ACB7HUF5_MANES|nr:hypothetical protein MANES_05G130301v8 [Manihot esculenta]
MCTQNALAPSFCFICGLFDHTERFYRKLLNLGNALVVRKFVLELCVNYPRPQSHGSRWLKGGGGENNSQGPWGITFGNSITDGQTTPPNPVDNGDRDMDGIREDSLNSYPTAGEEVARGLEAGVTIVDPKRRCMGLENKKANREKPTMDHESSGGCSNQSKNGVAAGPGLELSWAWQPTSSSGYYGEADRNFRHLSWQQLRILASHHEAPWVCLGDFNDILLPSKKRSSHPQPSCLINGFRDALCDSGLIEFPMTGYPFIWEHGRNIDGWVESRLDRVFTNTQWRTEFSNSTAKVLGFSTSDHLPILLAVKCFVDQCHAHRFRFENTWLLEAGYMSVEGKLVACRTALKSWGTNLRLLHKAEIDESLVVHMDEFLQAKSCFFHRLNLREVFWKQCAKQFWLKEDLEECVPLLVSHDQNASLLAPYSCDKVKSAAFSMKIDKSLRLDGFDPWSLPPNDLRPIALCNVVYKIMTKMIVNRLKSILPSIKELSRAFKMDINKGYDRLEWSFIRDMLIRMGEISPILPTRGLRQGDPLSPYLFILCAEGLSRLLQDNINHGNLHGFRISRGGPQISHLFFANDSLIFFRANVQEALELKRILRIYENAYGKLINFKKSSISFSKYTPVALWDSICSVLQVEEKPNLGNYLGLPSHVGSNKREVCSFVKDRL